MSDLLINHSMEAALGRVSFSLTDLPCAPWDAEHRDVYGFYYGYCWPPVPSE